MFPILLDSLHVLLLQIILGSQINIISNMSKSLLYNDKSEEEEGEQNKQVKIPKMLYEQNNKKKIRNSLC